MSAASVERTSRRSIPASTYDRDDMISSARRGRSGRWRRRGRSCRWSRQHEGVVLPGGQRLLAQVSTERRTVRSEPAQRSAGEEERIAVGPRVSWKRPRCRRPARARARPRRRRRARGCRGPPGRHAPGRQQGVGRHDDHRRHGHESPGQRDLPVGGEGRDVDHRVATRGAGRSRWRIRSIEGCMRVKNGGREEAITRQRRPPAEHRDLRAR